MTRTETSGEAPRSGPVRRGELRPGDRVRVRPARAILETLDDTGALEGVPFLPEMVQHIGQTFPVYKRVEKICDYFGEETRTRRMTGTVLLSTLRCDGTAHGGCEAECRIFWKEDWLEHPGGEAHAPDALEDGVGALVDLLAANTRRTDSTTGEASWRCQITDAVGASTPMSERSPGQYVREVRVGNISTLDLIGVGAGAIGRKVGRRLRLVGELPFELAGPDRIDGERLDLQPGEWVRVRSGDEIGRTLNAAGAHRGLLFTAEMAPLCGKVFQVRRRVSRIIDERTGAMRELRNDCIVLEGAVCTGRRTPGAWLCPREHFPLWREDWLERVDAPATGP